MTNEMERYMPVRVRYNESVSTPKTRPFDVSIHVWVCRCRYFLCQHHYMRFEMVSAGPAPTLSHFSRRASRACMVVGTAGGVLSVEAGCDNSGGV